jgi:hypothetical protein
MFFMLSTFKKPSFLLVYTVFSALLLKHTVSRVGSEFGQHFAYFGYVLHPKTLTNRRRGEKHVVSEGLRKNAHFW